jgi:hypothetical protein
MILNRLRIVQRNILEQHSRMVPPTPVIVANGELAGDCWRFYMNLLLADATVDAGGGVRHVCREKRNGNRSDH